MNGQPIDRVNMALDFERDWFGFTARTNRFGEVLSPGADEFNDLLLEAKWITDMEVRMRPWQKLERAVGADNIFNVHPTRAPTGQGRDPVTGAVRNYSVNTYFLPFSSVSPFGFNGRFVYLRGSLNF